MDHDAADVRTSDIQTSVGKILHSDRQGCHKCIKIEANQTQGCEGRSIEI